MPDAFLERLTHYGFHRLEITDKDGHLVIRKKKDYIQDQEVVELFRNKAHVIFPKWVAKFPFHFHVRYYWAKRYGGIKYQVLNPECPADWPTDWPFPELGRPNLMQAFFSLTALKKGVLTIVRQLFSQNRRNRSLDILSLLQCPDCRSTLYGLNRQKGLVNCNDCGKSYSLLLPGKTTS